MKKAPAVVVLAVAFAYVEAAVVEYLRVIYYPLEQGGFRFPILTLGELQALGGDHARRLLIELGREISTLVMLACVGAAAGSNRREAWAHFLIAFGVWDIFYYVWLKLFLDWPDHLLTWDLLFLVPVPWVGPLLAPILISSAMIACGITVLRFESTGRPIIAKRRDWALIVAGGLIAIASFCWDYENIMAGNLPSPFQWPLFLAGLLLSGGTFVGLALRAIGSRS